MITYGGKPYIGIFQHATNTYILFHFEVYERLMCVFVTRISFYYIFHNLGLSPTQVVPKIAMGYTLPCPDNRPLKEFHSDLPPKMRECKVVCPTAFDYQMRACWKKDPEDRPTFLSLFNFFETYENNCESYKSEMK